MVLKSVIPLRYLLRGSVHHSDCGSQYCSAIYRKVFSSNGFIEFRSRKVNCWDNAVTENVFKTLKAALLWRQEWMAHHDVEQGELCINDFYDPQRRSSP